MISVYLAGEGAFDLGGRAGHRAYHNARPGVIEALLRACVAEGWEVRGARPWKDIPKFRARPGESMEAQNVRGAVLDAREAMCDVLVFVRDRDRSDDREHIIEQTLDELEEAGARVVGGVARECLDAWVLAVAGKLKAEQSSSAAAKRARMDVAATTDAAVALVEQRGVSSIPEDATSLQRWLERARAAFDRLCAAPPGSAEPG